ERVAGGNDDDARQVVTGRVESNHVVIDRVISGDKYVQDSFRARSIERILEGLAVLNKREAAVYGDDIDTHYGTRRLELVSPNIDCAAHDARIAVQVGIGGGIGVPTGVDAGRVVLQAQVASVAVQEKRRGGEDARS